MKTVMLALFLALLAQGEEMFFKLTELLPSAPEVNWPTNLVIEDVVAKAADSSNRQVKLASATVEPQLGFPDRLGIGSREVLRDYIVATNNMGMGVFLTLQYYKSTGGYSKLNIGRRSDGHASFRAMLEDAEPGFDLLIEALKKKTDYKVGSDIWAQVSVTYFNDRNDIEANPFGLSLPRNQGVRDTLNSKRIAESFLSSDPTRDMEIMVAPFPPIKKFELQLSLTNNTVATMTWTKESGAQLASWPKEFPEKIKEQYIAISGWLCDGTHRIRIKITTSTGEEIYTELGDRLSKPTVVTMRNGSTLVINAPLGADFVEVLSSQDLVNLTSRGFVPRVTGPIVLSVPNEGHMFFITRTSTW